MSSELLARFDEMVARFKQEFNDIIENERGKMKAEVEAYNAEKARMATISVRDDDIIHLNISGLKMTTTRSTLCQVEGSLLASMFSGRWEDSVQRDKDGAVFLDFNPQHFSVILDYLRVKKISSSEDPAPLPNVPEDQKKEFDILVKYLGLSDELLARSDGGTVVREEFNMHSAGVTLQESGQVAVTSSHGSFIYVLGNNLYNRGKMRIKLRFESFNNTKSMFCGIATDITHQKGTSSFNWPGSYGWGIGKNHHVVWKDGILTYSSDNDPPTSRNLVKQGDTITLVLDCSASKLSLHLAAGQEFHMDIPRSKTDWRLNVHFDGQNDKVRIIND